jgi:5'-deoxynucleotidase YfbR-like HD superfamily hydrolase
VKALVEATLYRDAGAVKRYHVKRTHRYQTIAEHTFGMLMLVKQVTAGKLSDERKVDLYEAILHHDLPELFTGGPLMDSIEEGLTPLYMNVEDLFPEDAVLVKWADRMELVLWCLEEVRMGNTNLIPTVARGLGWILAVRIPDCAQALTEEVVADALTVGIAPATGAELEMNA